MSSIVAGILGAILGLLSNIVRDVLARRLKDGDVIDETFRNLLIKELSAVSANIFGHARAKLLTSLTFLEDGVNLLCVAFENKRERGESSESQSPAEDNWNEQQSGSESDMLGRALELALKNLNRVSKCRLRKATEKFNRACMYATEAFQNETLDLKDRVLAAKVRIVSDVLENLGKPRTAIVLCLGFLKKLNCIPKIGANFLLFVHGGLKWMLSTEAHREEVTEIVKSVLLINYFLFQLCSQFSDKYPAFTWSTIKVSDYNINPIISFNEILESKCRPEEFIQLSHELNLGEQTNLYCVVVNNQSHIIAVNHSGLKVIFPTGENKTIQLNDPARKDGNSEVFDQRTTGLTVDKDDNVYVLRLFKKYGKKIDENVVVLFVLNQEYSVEVIKELSLPKLALFFTGLIKLAVNENYVFVVVDSIERADLVYVFSNTGEYQRMFEWEHSVASQCFLRAFANNKIKLAVCDEVCLKLYKPKEDSSIAITLPVGHKVCGIVYHFTIGKIVMLTYVVKEESYFLLCFEKEGDQVTSMFFCKNNHSGYSPVITSHPGGPVAVVREKIITYL